jgi:hypothetical protein
MHRPIFRSALALATLAAGLLVPGHAPASGGTPASPAIQSQQSAPQNGQQNQQPPQSGQTLKVQTALVNVFVTVRDKSHFIINNLKQEDFKIFEDGQEQKVAYFSKEVNLPISLAILVDTSGSQVDVLGAEQDAASRFVHRVLRKTDEALVMSFDTDVNLLADFTEDRGVLDRAIHSAQVNAAGS